jgi:hypothetical protein
LFPKQEQREGKTIIVLQVPLSSQIHRHNGEIYLRSEDGDYRVKAPTNSPVSLTANSVSSLSRPPCRPTPCRICAPISSSAPAN